MHLLLASMLLANSGTYVLYSTVRHTTCEDVSLEQYNPLVFDVVDIPGSSKLLLKMGDIIIELYPIFDGDQYVYDTPEYAMSVVFIDEKFDAWYEMQDEGCVIAGWIRGDLITEEEEE